MKDQYFKAVRLSLFTKSYAGHYFAQIIKTSQNANELSNKVAQTLLFPDTILAFFLISPNSKKAVNKIIQGIDTKDKHKIKVYLKIEQQLIQLIQDKSAPEDYVTEEYEHALIAPAIERVAGNSLSRITNDFRFEREIVKRKQLYTYYYYSVAAKYCLPTLRIIPFLERIIKIP